MLSRPVAAFCFLLLLCSLAEADPLWVSATGDGDSVGALPSHAVEIVPVSVPVSGLDTVAEGVVWSLALSADITLDYRVVSVTRFPNGDIGVRAERVDAPADSNHILSLTVGQQDLLATVYSPAGRHLLKATRAGASFVGHLYREDNSLRKLPADAPAPARAQQVDAITNSDVSIQQTVSAEYVTIGEILAVTVEVTNNSNATINNENLVVNFILDAADFVDATAGCEAKDVQYSNGVFKELHCPVNNLAPGGKLNISYQARMTDRGRPNVPSFVVLDGASNTSFVWAVFDTVTDTDSDGITDYIEGLLGTNTASASSGPSAGATAEIDLLLLFTPRYVTDTDGDAITAINQLLQETNDIYAQSSTGIVFRPVMYRQVDYVVPNDLDPAFNDLTQRNGIFADVDYQRAVSGADLVVLLDGRLTGGQSCGIAEGSGAFTRGDFSNEQGVSTVVFAPGPNAANDSVCSVDTLAHELGHLLGLVHSRVESADGTFPWALGHGVTGSFHTIMAYDAHFPNADTLPVFSDPARTTCKGQPCGVSRDDASNGADAVHALHITRHQVSRYFGQRPILAMVNASEAPTQASASGGVIRTGGPNGAGRTFANQFGNLDVLNLATSLQLDPAHVGRIGVTHIVISAPGVGTFQVNSAGAYVPWDLNPANLLGNIAPRPLQATEELTAFRDLTFNSIGINAVSLTVYFAYSLQGSSDLVYTATGVPLVIQ